MILVLLEVFIYFVCFLVFVIWFLKSGEILLRYCLHGNILAMGKKEKP